MRFVAFAFAALALAGTAQAQLGRDEAAELLRARRNHQNKVAEVDRLVDRRFRLDLGIPQEKDPTLQVAPPMTTAEQERQYTELKEIESATAAYTSRYNELKRSLEELRSEMEAKEAARRERENFIVVPQAGASQAPEGGHVSAIAGERQPQSSRAVVTGAPGPTELGPVPLELDPAVRLDEVRGWIRGSKDHLKVAQALFRAGRKSMEIADRARKVGNAELVVEFDRRAKDSLERAVAELDSLLKKPEPDYAVLFCKGRCLELLFRQAVRLEGLSLERSTKRYQQREQDVRDPFLAISARDVAKDGAQDQVAVLGPWGRAAQAAVEHFRWVNIHGTYTPTASIESLTWPGEKDQ